MSFPSFSAGEVLTAADMNAVGLWLVSTTTIGTGVTSVPVNNCFSSTYQNYRIVIENESSNGGASHLATLSGNASNYYMGGHIFAWTVSATAYVPAPQIFFVLSANNSAGVGANITWDITNPFITRRKYGWVTSQSANGAYAANLYNLNTTSSTGFTLTKGGDTMTGGTIRVYGYRN